MIDLARAYHEATKHSDASLRENRHGLDFENQPLPFKIYTGIEPLALPRDLAPDDFPAIPALRAIGRRDTGGDRVPDLADLARVLFYSAGITKRKSHPGGGGEVYFRAASNTGALYHIDLYLVCGELPDLAAGVYHFGPHDFALRALRAGDYRGILVEASGGDTSLGRAPAILVSASTYWRNAWKYQARAYRHCYWDGGTLHANLLAIATSRELHPQLVTGFADARVEQLLGLDPVKEGALTLVALGSSSTPAPAVRAPADLALETETLSAREIDYPAIRELHAASSFKDGGQAAAWREAPIAGAPAPAAETGGVPLQPLADADCSDESLEKVIRRRGSTRVFERGASISLEQLATALDCASVALPTDWSASSPLVDFYLIAQAVDGLAAGRYHHDYARGRLDLLQPGENRALASRLGLFQDLPGDAAANIYSLLDLDPLLAARGDRGYRVAQLEGGIRGGLLYLAAYALQFGATGLTFLDDEVTDAFSPHARGKSVMFLTALGRSIRRHAR